MTPTSRQLGASLRRTATYIAAVTAHLPLGLRPMLLNQRRDPFDGARWLFEPKWDGWRALALVDGGRSLLLSRNGHDLTKSFPAVAEAVRALPSGAILDGELVVLDGQGRPDFDALMRRDGAPRLLAFDVLSVRSRDICSEPLEERKRRLEALVADLADAALQKTDGIVGEGQALFKLVRSREMEGVVAKRLGSPYLPGRRTGAWVKVKVPGYAPDRAEWFERSRRQA